MGPGFGNFCGLHEGSEAVTNRLLEGEHVKIISFIIHLTVPHSITLFKFNVGRSNSKILFLMESNNNNPDLPKPEEELIQTKDKEEG